MKTTIVSNNTNENHCSTKQNYGSRLQKAAAALLIAGVGSFALSRILCHDKNTFIQPPANLQNSLPAIAINEIQNTSMTDSYAISQYFFTVVALFAINFSLTSGFRGIRVKPLEHPVITV